MLHESIDPFVALSQQKSQYQPSLMADGTIDGKTYKALRLQSDADDFILLVDPVTNIPAYKITQDTDESGASVTYRTQYIENKATNGFLFSTKNETVDKDGKVIQKSEISEVKVNVTIPQGFFDVK
jgi:type II secretory pathway component GspD/PulD (secretin)